MNQFVQGDMMFIRLADKTVDKQIKDADEKLVAMGEKTGHAHRIFGSGFMFVVQGCWPKRFLQADQDLEIRHDEHPPLKLLPGIYEVRRQRVFDYSSFKKAVVED